MGRVGMLLLAAVSLAALPVSAWAGKKSKTKAGVFATINGKKLNAPSNGKVDDPCVHGIYNATDGVITFAALECRGAGRRKNVRPNYKAVVFACGVYQNSLGGFLQPPFEIYCPGSAYQEWKTGRFRIPKSSVEWMAKLDLVPEVPGGPPVLVTSKLRLRVESIDGATLRGTFAGVFDQPGPGATSPEAAISGEGQFSFPFEIR